MKNIIRLLTLLFAVTTLSAGTLQFSTNTPQISGEVAVTYEAEGGTGDYTLLVYHFQIGQSLPLAEALELTPNAKIRVGAEDNFLLMKVMDSSGKIDDNNGRLWDLLIYTNGKPVRDAFFNRALSYLGATGENYTRVPSYEIIKNSLDSELQNYPKNFRAKLALVTLKFDFKLIDFDEYDKEVRDILDTRIDMSNELDISAAIKYLNSIDEKDKAEELESHFISNNPNSYLAKDKRLRDLSNVNSFDDFVENLTKYLNKYYNDNNISKLYDSFVYAHSQSRKYMEDLAEDIEPLTHKPAFLYNEIALTYLESEDLKKDYTEAEILAKVDTNVKMAWSKIDELKDYKPRDVTVPEWNLYVLKVKSDLYLTQYKLNLLKNDSLEASKSVYEAISNAPHQMNALLYKEALNLNLKYGDAAQLKRLIEFAYSNDVVDRELQNYILGVIGKGDGVDINFVNGLIEKNTAKHNLQLKNSLVKGTQLSGFVQTPEKTFVDLESLKGKIKIISINSTWCDVCTQVYPILNEIYAKYQANTSVSVIGLSVWEDDEPIDAVNEMIGEFKIKFPYYIDNTDIIPRKYDVFGFPTILIVDKDNYVRYTIRGFANGEELVKLIDGFVNMLN